MTVSVVVAGAGWVSTHRHIPAMRTHGGYQIAGVVDRNEARARAVGERLRVPWFVGTVPSEATFFSDADAVVCGGAPFVHGDLAKDALGHGKHFLTEKPFTMTLAEGREVVGLAGMSDRQLAIVHNFQFSRSFRTVEKWIAAGRLGSIRGVHAVQFSNPNRRLPTWIDQLPLGLFYDESPHLLYLVRRLVQPQPLSLVAAIAHPGTIPGSPTPAVVEAHFRSGDVPVIVQMNFEAAVSEWHVTVTGERGTAVCDIFRDIPIFVPDDGLHDTRRVLRTSIRASLGHWAGYVRNGVPHLRGSLLYGNDEVFARFHNAVTTNTAPPGVGAEDALAVLEMQHAVIEAARSSLGTG